jgi:hypothetical protein
VAPAPPRGREQSDPDQGEADLADRHEGEQTLEVVLAQRHHRANERREDGEGDEHRSQSFDVRR